MRAGDTILVHAGLYRYNHLEYGGANRAFPFEGTYYLTADGTPERPIAIKAAGDGEVVFDGNGNFALFNVMAADHTYFEGITFRNTEFRHPGRRAVHRGLEGLTVKHSRFENVGVGVFTSYSGSSNFYIADNRFYGRHDPDRLIGWSDAPLWGRFDGVDGQVHPPVMASYVAVKVYGPGHVVAHNYIADFHDGINVETYGNPDGSVASARERPTVPGTRPASTATGVRAIDFYNNYITNPTTTRSRPTGACTTCRAAEPVHQPPVGRVLQPARARRARLLDPEHRLQPAGRLEPLLRRGRGRLLQQHHPVGDHGDAVELALRNNAEH